LRLNKQSDHEHHCYVMHARTIVLIRVVLRLAIRTAVRVRRRVVLHTAQFQLWISNVARAPLSTNQAHCCCCCCCCCCCHFRAQFAHSAHKQQSARITAKQTSKHLEPALASVRDIVASSVVSLSETTVKIVKRKTTHRFDSTSRRQRIKPTAAAAAAAATSWPSVHTLYTNNSQHASQRSSERKHLLHVVVVAVTIASVLSRRSSLHKFTVKTVNHKILCPLL